MRKLSLKNVEGMLSRKEMKNIMAGSSSGCSTSGQTCTVNTHTQTSTCCQYLICDQRNNSCIKS